MHTQTISPPRTALEVFRGLPEGTLCEVLNNTLYINPAPRYNHQRMVLFLGRKISDSTEKYNPSEVIISPIDVYLFEHNSH